MLIIYILLLITKLIQKWGYIYLKYWPNNKISQSLKNKLINNENIKIVYNYPNYIKCLLKK